MRIVGHEALESIQVREQVLLRPVQHDEAGAVIRPAVFLTIIPLAADWDEQVAREVPGPEPEVLGVEKDGKGKPVIVDGQVVKRYKTDDPDYKRRVAKTNKRQAVAMLISGIEPGQLEFNARKEELGPEPYYDAVLQELKAFGFSAGDMALFIERIGLLSGMKKEDFDAATRTFFEKGS